MDVLIYIIGSIISIFLISWIYLIFKYSKKQYLLLKEMALVNGVNPDDILKVHDREAYAYKMRTEMPKQ